MPELADAPELRSLLEGADHVDVKTAESDLSMREFIATALEYRPAWLRGLFAARTVIARLLRLEKPSAPSRPALRAQDISFVPGDEISFFTVLDAAEDRFIILEAADSHLVGYLAFLISPGERAANRYQAVTVVKYLRWTGPLYFNVIRPFHHLVVRRIIDHAARSEPSLGR
jgi:hypothetical protein